MSELQQRAKTIIAETLDDLELEWSQSAEDTFVATLPGEHKLRTECALVVGSHTLQVRAFVARNPDENHVGVYRWMLEHNLKSHGISFCVDRLGDIYLSGRISLESVTTAEIDRLLGAVSEDADGSFNTILELGFAESIKREWSWRISRGESTKNLEAFRHLAEK